MLGEQVVRDEGFAFEGSFGNDTGPFLEQIGRDTAETHRHLAFFVMDNERQCDTVGRFDERTVGHHPAKTNLPRRYALARDIFGGIEITGTVFQARHGEYARPDNRRQCRKCEDEPLMLGFHPPEPLCAAFSAARIDAHAQRTTADVPPIVTT